MTDPARRFHEEWLGMVQPSEGLVVSASVLVEAQCFEREGRAVQEKLAALLWDVVLETDGPKKERPKRARVLLEILRLFEEVLGLTADLFDLGDALPKELRLYVVEGKQELRPTMALKKRGASEKGSRGAVGTEKTAAAKAGEAYTALVWQVPPEVDLDKPETLTGPWLYPAQAKFDRLLRECRVPIGLLTNGRELRLVYAPHGESSGWLSFRFDDMAQVGGRPILDAFVMLLGRARLFSVAEDVQLPALLERSRREQANVTSDLAGQVFEALEELLAGFAAAAERDPQNLLLRTLEDEGTEKVYSGLLTLLLRLVFILYSEDRGLLPVEQDLYQKNYSVLGLYAELERDFGRMPDSMDRRYGAYPRLVSLFRAIFLGAKHGDFFLPARRGDLFDPHRYGFLEGWAGESAPIGVAEQRSAVEVPRVSDGTIYRVLRRLLYLGGERLSYRALDVEQIGSVYEALMGFDVARVVGGAVRVRLGSKRSAARVWIDGAELFEKPKNQREKWLTDELGFDKAVAKKIADATAKCASVSATLEVLEPFSGKNPERALPGALVIQPGPERRRTSSHYTPRSLSEPIVKRTLEPLIAAMDQPPSSEALLNLVICDPAMGSGAFLVAACRYLADHVVAAWTREQRYELLAARDDTVENYARRLVAQRCLYGVDKNAYAVELARLSLWLVTMAKNEPFTFVDHALRHGDSLVGLSFDQIRAFHWQTGQKYEQAPTIRTALANALEESIRLRQRIQELASEQKAEASREKESLLADAQDATERVRLIADVIVGAFFSSEKDKERDKERLRRLDLVQLWLGAKTQVEADERALELKSLQAELHETQTPFHWTLEFPEVFYQERPDPLDGGRVNGAAMVEAFVGNPPFLGGKMISTMNGDAYSDWLDALHAAGKNGDLSAHFFRRAASLLGAHGTIGLIATNTIGQGDTRAAGLQYLANHEFSIYAATRDMPWPGDAAVTVSVAHLAKGRPQRETRLTLDERTVEAINSRLRPKPERPDPERLIANASLSFQGSIVLGMGFTLTPEERDALIQKNAKNAERIFPYLGGEEVNTSPTQAFDRYVISFGQMELSEAEQWPDLLEILCEKVKPERDKTKNNEGGKIWWQHWRPRAELYAAIAPLSRCLVNSQVSKHLVFAFQPTDRIFGHTLYAYPLETHTPFALLQSRIHEFWARLLSSSMKTDLRYAASDCFETFPFPCGDPRTVLPELEALGEKLYEARAKYMVDTNQGLTKTYNALKDPNVTDPRILELRALHEELDRAVLRAYAASAPTSRAKDAWLSLKVPPYCLTSDEDRAALSAFEDEIIDRLFELNADRSATEKALGQTASKGSGKGSKGAKSTASGAAKGKKGAKNGIDDGGAQGSLF
jgi:hypothetical protein